MQKKQMNTNTATIPTLLDTDTVSEILGVSAATLERWRSNEIVRLPFIRVGPRRIMYRDIDISRYLELRLNRSSMSK